jgi:hypothetical protein
MSKKRLIETVGKCKVYWDSEFQEYTIMSPDRSLRPIYFTDDKTDAIETAKFYNNVIENGVLES